MPLADTAQLTAVIIGTDALLAARPATAIQLARACMRAGYDFVAPVSWGEELLATHVIDEVRRTSVPASVIVNCPFVAEALRAESAALPTCWRSVSPPVATARYLRSAFSPRNLHITYAGRCPGATAPDIDACVLPDVFLGHLLEAGLAPENQPRYFEEVVPPDRARYSSLPGGVPEAAALQLHGGARLREAAPATVGTVALTFESPEPVVIDLESACGCICARDRFAAAQMEPPRASAPVVSAEVVVDLAPHREERVVVPFHARPVEVSVERDAEPPAGPVERDEGAWAGEMVESEASASETLDWFVESRAAANEPANAGPAPPTQHTEASLSPHIPAFPDFAEFEAAWSQMTAGIASDAGAAGVIPEAEPEPPEPTAPEIKSAENGVRLELSVSSGAQPAGVNPDTGENGVRLELSVSLEAQPSGVNPDTWKTPADPALTVSVEPWVAPRRARPVVTPIGALSGIDASMASAPASFTDAEVPRIPLPRADMAEAAHAPPGSAGAAEEGEQTGTPTETRGSSAAVESPTPPVGSLSGVERPRIVSRIELSSGAPSIVEATASAPAPEVEAVAGELAPKAAGDQAYEPAHLAEWTPERAIEANLERIAEGTPEVEADLERPTEAAPEQEVAAAPELPMEAAPEQEVAGALDGTSEATTDREVASSTAPSPSTAPAASPRRSAPFMRGARGTPVYAPLRAALGAMEHEEKRARRATYFRRALVILGITVLVVVGSVFAASLLSSRGGDGSNSAQVEPPRLAPAEVAPASLDTVARPDTSSAPGAISRDSSGVPPDTGARIW